MKNSLGQEVVAHAGPQDRSQDHAPGLSVFLDRVLPSGPVQVEVEQLRAD